MAVFTYLGHSFVLLWEKSIFIWLESIWDDELFLLMIGIAIKSLTNLNRLFAALDLSFCRLHTR